MSNIYVLQLLVPTSAFTGGSLIAREVCPLFSAYWWTVFVLVSISLWIATHVVVHKYIASASH